MPLIVDVRGRRVVVVGGGAVAQAKSRPLQEAGADLVVVAPEVGDAWEQAAAAGHLTWHARPYRTGDLAGAFLAVAATDDLAVNAQVAADAAAQATFCVRSGRRSPAGVGEDPDEHAEAEAPGSAALPGIVRRGDLLVAVSTSGRAPVVARRVRQQLEGWIGPEYGALVDLLGELREAAETRAAIDGLGSAERRAAWRSVPLADILTLLRSGDDKSARELALACLSSSSD